MNNKRSLALAIMLIVLVIIVVGGAIYTVSKQPPQRSDTNTQQKTLTKDDLDNGTYVYENGLDYFSGKTQKFQAGRSEFVDEAGVTSWLELNDRIAIGDLNNDGQSDAVIIVDSRFDALDNGGSSASQLILSAVVEQQGKLRVVANKYIGSSKFGAVTDLTLQSGIITVTFSDLSLGQAVIKTSRYKLAGNTLIEQ